MDKRDPDEDEDSERLEDPLGDFKARLTPAQFRVFDLVTQGLPEKKIAQKLALTIHTVHTHIKEIYRTLGVHSRSELLATILKLPEERETQKSLGVRELEAIEARLRERERELEKRERDVGERLNERKAGRRSTDESSFGAQLMFDLHIEPGNATASDVADVLEALSDLQAAAGGLGLEFKIDGNLVLAHSEVPV